MFTNFKIKIRKFINITLGLAHVKNLLPGLFRVQEVFTLALLPHIQYLYSGFIEADEDPPSWLVMIPATEEKRELIFQ